MSKSETPNQEHQCPICRKPVTVNGQFFPFCSKQCKMIDLGKWADEGYRISRPIEQADFDEQ